jgi:excisionase family DNA binding protein
MRLDRLLSVKDVARRWCVCTATVYGLAKSGRLPCLRVGNSIRFRLEQVEAYERSREAAASERRSTAPASCVRL